MVVLPVIMYQLNCELSSCFCLFHLFMSWHRNMIAPPVPLPALKRELPSLFFVFVICFGSICWNVFVLPIYICPQKHRLSFHFYLPTVKLDHPTCSHLLKHCSCFYLSSEMWLCHLFISTETVILLRLFLCIYWNANVPPVYIYWARKKFLLKKNKSTETWLLPVYKH